MRTFVADLACVVLGLAGLGTVAVFAAAGALALAADFVRWAVRGW